MNFVLYLSEIPYVTRSNPWMIHSFHKFNLFKDNLFQNMKNNLEGLDRGGIENVT